MEELPLEFAQAVYYLTATKEEQMRDLDVRRTLMVSVVSGMAIWLTEHGYKRATFEVIKDAEEWTAQEGLLGKEYTTIETRVRLLEHE
jgi:hypothetical protein